LSAAFLSLVTFFVSIHFSALKHYNKYR
jgi:hypothetical protein